MIINYLQKKQINHAQIQELLKESIGINIFSNNGPAKKCLENHLHNYLNLLPEKKIVCVNSGTSALHLLFLYCQQKYCQKLEWATHSFNFPSVVTNNNNTQIYDIDNNYSLDLNLEQYYDGVVIPTLFGTIPKNFLEWVNIENKIVIFDHASCPLSTFENKNVCNYGTYCIGSFHTTKFLGIGEGGFIICNKDEYDVVNSLSNFGFLNNRKYNKYSSNFKMSDIAAVYILSHIIDYDLKKHFDVQDFLIKELQNDGRFELFNYSKDVVYGNLPILFKDIAYGNLSILFKNETFVHKFRDLGIEVNKYHYPLNENHRNSWNLYNKIINFPLNASLTDYQIEYMLRQIKNV